MFTCFHIATRAHSIFFFAYIVYTDNGIYTGGFDVVSICSCDLVFKVMYLSFHSLFKPATARQKRRLIQVSVFSLFLQIVLLFYINLTHSESIVNREDIHKNVNLR